MTEAHNPIRVAVVTGSIRDGNFTAKAARLVIDELQQSENVSVIDIDPANIALAMPGTPSTAAADAMRETVQGADGIILATPEYHGSFSSVMKLVIENLGFPSVLAGKPIALLGVAAGAIGAIKSLEHLRSVCSHIGAIVLPSPVSVPNVQTVFDANGNCTDEAIERRIRRTATTLLDYVKR